MAGGRSMPETVFLSESRVFVMCVGILFGALCYCCPAPCDCPAHDNSTLCRHRLLTLVPADIPYSSYVLDLSYNHIRSVPSNAFTQLKYLQELDLSYNQLTKVEPGVFSSLPGLRILLLHHNQLKLLPSGVFLGMPVLSWLDIRGNQLVILLDHTFQGLMELKHLEAGENPLVFISPGAFIGMPLLQRLGLEDTKLSGVPSNSLSVLPRLSELRLGGISNNVLRDLSFLGFPWLRVLDMDRWSSLVLLCPHSLSGLNLSSLSLTHCNLSSIPQEAIRAQIYLQRLDLSHNPISKLPSRGFRTLRRLEELRLHGGRLRSVPSGAFFGLSQLRLLDLSDNPITWLAEDALPSPLGFLDTIVLSGTMLSCDCRLCWLLYRRLHFGGKSPVCAAPASLQGMVIPDNPEMLCPDLFTCQPPKILNHGPSQLKVREGDMLTMICQTLGVPEPSIQWVLPPRAQSGSGGPTDMSTICPTTSLQRHASARTESMEVATDLQSLEPPDSRLEANAAKPALRRVTILPDDSIQFHPVQAEDAGAYLCVATNMAGNDSAWVHLVVLPFNRSEAPASFATIHGNLIAVITAGGILPFISSVTLCFIFMFLWSRSRGNIKHTANIEYVPRGHRGESDIEDNKFTMKLL